MRGDVMQERQLAVQVRLEPEHRLLVGAEQAGIPCVELGAHVRERAGARLRKPLRAHGAELRRGRLAAQRALVERVRPGDYLARHASLAQHREGVIAVGYVEHIRSIYW